MLAYELAVLKARGHMDSIEGKEYLVRKMNTVGNSIHYS